MEAGFADKVGQDDTCTFLQPMLNQSMRDRHGRGQKQLTAAHLTNDVIRTEPARILQLAAEFDIARRGASDETDHQRCRKRPWLRGVIFAILDNHAGFLEYLATDCILQRLARFDKTSQRRVAAFRPTSLAAEQAGVIVGDDHDHGGIGARKLISATFRIGAMAAMTGGNEQQHGAANRAMPRACLPMRESTGVGEQAGVERRQLAASAAQVEPARIKLQRKRITGGIFDDSEEIVGFGVAPKKAGVLFRYPALAVVDQAQCFGVRIDQGTPVVAQHDEAAAGGLGALREVCVVAITAFAFAVQRQVAVGVRATASERTHLITPMQRLALMQRHSFNAYSENEEPQPQVVFALGLRITNCAPVRDSV